MGLLLTTGRDTNAIMVWRVSKKEGLTFLKKFTVHIRPITCMTEVQWLGLAKMCLLTGSE